MPPIIVWRKTPGRFGGILVATKLKQNFGEPSPGSGGGGAVPEPKYDVV